MADRKKKLENGNCFLPGSRQFADGMQKAEPELVSTARTPYEKLAYDTTEVKKEI